MTATNWFPTVGERVVYLGGIANYGLHGKVLWTAGRMVMVKLSNGRTVHCHFSDLSPL